MVDSLSNGIMKNTNDDKENTLLDKTKQDKNKEFFSELLRRGGPLFEVGFSPDHLFYQKKIMKDANVHGLYFHEDAKDSIYDAAVNYSTSTGREIFGEVAERIKNKEIPNGDFVFMSGTMVPNDKVYTGLRKNDVAEMGTFSGAVSVRDLLDRSDELGTHLEEFAHRALRVVPELNEWRKKNLSSESEEIFMGALIAKYFPEIAKYEHERIKRVYKADLTTDWNKKLSNKWISEIEEISNNILRKKGIKIKPKPKPKPDSIMDKPKIEPKPKPKPDEKEKTWMEFIKSLFN